MAKTVVRDILGLGWAVTQSSNGGRPEQIAWTMFGEDAHALKRNLRKRYPYITFKVRKVESERKFPVEPIVLEY